MDDEGERKKDISSMSYKYENGHTETIAYSVQEQVRIRKALHVVNLWLKIVAIVGLGILIFMFAIFIKFPNIIHFVFGRWVC